MKVIIDSDLCTGCELCVGTCPEAFEMAGDIAKAVNGEVPADAEECARQATEDCPVAAITIED